MSYNINLDGDDAKTIADAMKDFVCSQIIKQLADKYDFDSAEAAKFLNVANIIVCVEPIHEMPPMSNVVKHTTDIYSILGENFAKCIGGYHLLNNDPVKETPWEDINAIILGASGYPVTSQSNGSHKPGGDLSCSLGCFSNKSTHYKTGNSSFDISSYRLTTVCSDKNTGEIGEIISEINKRKNFGYYSIIAREETDHQILYDWYLIPSDFPAFNPASYEWRPKLGKSGKNKGDITGWETVPAPNGSSMSITFSMSSQLWIYVNITPEMKKFVAGSCCVKRGRKYNYIQLFEKELVGI